MHCSSVDPGDDILTVTGIYTAVSNGVDGGRGDRHQELPDALQDAQPRERQSVENRGGCVASLDCEREIVYPYHINRGKGYTAT